MCIPILFCTLNFADLERDKGSKTDYVVSRYPPPPHTIHPPHQIDP